MEPAQSLGNFFSATRNNRQVPEHHTFQTDTQDSWNQSSTARADQHGRPLHSVRAFRHPGTDCELAMLPSMPAEDCPWAETGQDCSFRCVLCDLSHECLYCGCKERQGSGSAYISPFNISYQIPYTLSLQLNNCSNGNDFSFSASEKKPGEDSIQTTFIVQPEEMSQEHWNECAELNNAEDEGEDLPQTRPSHLPEVSYHGHAELNPDVSEESEDEISSRAESEIMTGYACILCDEPDHIEDMVGCDLDSGWFHLSCVGLTSVPVGNWYCPFCISDKPQTPKERAAPDCSSSPCQPISTPRSGGQTNQPTAVTPSECKSTSHERSSSQIVPKGQTQAVKEPSSAKPHVPTGQSAPKKEVWQEREKTLVITLMQEMVKEGVTTETKWTIVSNRLRERFSVDRSAGSIKNWWNRNGRAISNVDERIVPKPDKLKTSATSPEKRRRERQMMKRKAEGADGDEFGTDPASGKRQKSNEPQPSQALDDFRAEWLSELHESNIDPSRAS